MWLCISARSYWKRLWIIQELALAREVVFFIGRRKYCRMAIQQYFNVARFTELWLSFASHNPIIYHIQTLLTSNSNVWSGLNLTQVLERFWTEIVDCENPRDHVYGLMGLVTTTQRLIIDYDKTTTELYDDLFDSVIRYLPEKGLNAYHTVLAWKLSDLASRLRMELHLTRGPLAIIRNHEFGDELQGLFRSLYDLEDAGFDKTTLSPHQIGSILNCLRKGLSADNWYEAGAMTREAASKPLLTYIATAAKDTQRGSFVIEQLEARVHALRHEAILPLVAPQVAKSSSSSPAQPARWSISAMIGGGLEGLQQRLTRGDYGKSTESRAVETYTMGRSRSEENLESDVADVNALNSIELT